NNEYCQQSPIGEWDSFGKVGEREDDVGYCNINCLCSYDPVGTPYCNTELCEAADCDANGFGDYTDCESYLGSDYSGELSCNLDTCGIDTSACVYEEPEDCTPGTTQNCPLQEGVCSGAQETCNAQGEWPGCTGANYGSDYEAGTELTCDDTLDNDCDGPIDGADSDCISEQCLLTNAYWEVNELDDEVMEGVVVSLTVEGTDCAGDVTFDIMEDDGILGTDPEDTAELTVSQVTATFSGGKAFTSWTSEWIHDDNNGAGDADPEFVFTASKSGLTFDSVDRLKVNHAGDCEEPYSGMIITEDTTLCGGEYDVYGSIEIDTDGVDVVCEDNTVINFGSTGGFRVIGQEDVLIQGCDLRGVPGSGYSGVILIQKDFGEGKISEDVSIINNRISGGYRGIQAIQDTQNLVVMNNEISNFPYVDIEGEESMPFEFSGDLLTFENNTIRNSYNTMKIFTYSEVLGFSRNSFFNNDVSRVICAPDDIYFGYPYGNNYCDDIRYDDGCLNWECDNMGMEFNSSWDDSTRTSRAIVDNPWANCPFRHLATGARMRNFDCDYDGENCFTLDLKCDEGSLSGLPSVQPDDGRYSKSSSLQWEISTELDSPDAEFDEDHYLMCPSGMWISSAGLKVGTYGGVEMGAICYAYQEGFEYASEPLNFGLSTGDNSADVVTTWSTAEHEPETYITCPEGTVIKGLRFREDSGDLDLVCQDPTHGGCSLEEYCWGECVDIMTSNYHCGGCYHTCGGGTTCVNGDCV
ncbi:hypothetical protein HOD53_03115, partial [Candidatus Woesearchaeota archaeon]|nr:hypothetical protein [Candidatus Woesearchaeota archaeon]